jgi:CRP-like cAMP-binding protein
LIDDLPRSASALAMTPTRLLILYRSHFEDLVAGDRAIALVVANNLLRLLAGYVRAANVTRVKTEVAVPAPTGDGSALPVAR